MSSGRFARGPSPGFRVGARLPVVRSGEPPEGHDVKVDLGGGGTDPHVNWGGRFEDIGAYVSHDEPSVKVISSAPGRGSTMTDVMRLAKDPKGKPTVSPNGKMVSDFSELSPAPWFGLTTRGRPDRVRSSSTDPSTHTSPGSLQAVLRLSGSADPEGRPG
jgi:hypothetical protein